MVHAEKGAAEIVEATARQAVAEIGRIIGRELARGMQADFVEHTSDMDEPADFGVGTAETGNLGHF
jgi:hypothetical protein